VVLYHHGETLAGALTVAQPRLTMKLRKIIADKGPWTAGQDLATAAGLRRLA
jgi:hypothetical protein